MATSGIYGAVIRIEIDYRRPGLLGDNLKVRGWLGAVKRVKFWCGFEISRDDDNEILVASKQELALVKMPEGKPTRLPHGLEKYIKE